MRLVTLESLQSDVLPLLTTKNLPVIQKKTNGVEIDLLISPKTKGLDLLHKVQAMQAELAEKDIPSSFFFDHGESTVDEGTHMALRFNNCGSIVRKIIGPNPENVSLVAIEQVLAKYPNPVKAVHAVREFIRATREERSVLPWGTQDDYRKRRKTARLILDGADT